MVIIIKEEQLKDLPTVLDDEEADAPPCYHHLDPSSSSSIPSESHTRPPPPLHPHRSTISIASSSSSSPSPCKSPPLTPTLATLIETKLEDQKAKFKSSLLDFLSRGTAQSIKDVKNMAHRSVLDVVKDPGAQQSVALIETCAEMCRAKGVNFSDILQVPCLEGHRALYWIIVGRPPPNEYGLLSTILKHSGPLSPAAIEEVRLACLQVGDQTLFNHVWKHPAYGALSGTDELLLGGATPTDCVEVQEAMTDEIAMFTARFEITQFHKRMGVSGKIAFEFIARGRLWCLKFDATPEKKKTALGPWAISLSLSIINPSPPTWLDSRIVIIEPQTKPLANLPPWPLPKGSAATSSASSPDPGREKPPIQFRLQTKTHQLQPSLASKSKGGRTELVAHLSDNPASSGLQYPNSTYYSSDGCLQVIMEAQLAKPETDKGGCIIS